VHIYDVRATVPATRLHYIDPNQTSPSAYSFHPNADGQEDFETVFENAIS